VDTGILSDGAAKARSGARQGADVAMCVVLIFAAICLPVPQWPLVSLTTNGLNAIGPTEKSPPAAQLPAVEQERAYREMMLELNAVEIVVARPQCPLNSETANARDPLDVSTLPTAEQSPFALHEIDVIELELDVPRPVTARAGCQDPSTWVTTNARVADPTP
jgi:hypothetical protein